ncbi:MAG: DUF3047 domain-containing protein [Rhodospirillales bacterium]|nr:DUF3047 domain-containing protein [Rhodospirillales bacterium]
MTEVSNQESFRFRLAPGLALLALLSACAAPRVGVDIDGKLDVLGPTPDLVAAGLPGDWISQGRVRPGQARVVERDGVPALRLIPGGDGFIVARRLEAALVMSPYLSWSWSMENHGEGLHPVRLIVGFHGGTQGGAGGDRAVRALFGAALPAHDRSFALAWADSALRRGSVLKPEGAEGPRAPLYIARGGRENADTWWLETVDLERIYRELWPGDDSARARVVFVGLAVTPATGDPPAAFVSGIRLSR